MSSNENVRNLPPGFFVGISTSATQVEGLNGHRSAVDDYYFANAQVSSKKALKNLAGYKGSDKEELKTLLSDLSTFHPNGAAHHYSLYRQDIRLFRELGFNAYRFSIPRWRIEPEKGKFDQKEIDHYADVIKAARDNNITPFPTLHHWDDPKHVTKEGGLLGKDFVKGFGEYVNRISHIFEGVSYVATLNEPVINAYKAYMEGDFPPGERKNLPKAILAVRQLVKAHKDSYSTLKEVDPNIQVGFTQNVVHFESLTASDKLLVWVARKMWNDLPYDLAGENFDWIGAQHYYTETFKYGKVVKREDVIHSELDKDVYPKGAYYEAKRLYKKYNKPLIFTEIGIPTRDDLLRQWHIKETLRNIHKAIEEGVDIRGYLAWCAFGGEGVVHEWNQGFDPRATFGLIKVDKATQERTPLGSAILLGEIAKKNAIEMREGLAYNLPL